MGPLTLRAGKGSEIGDYLTTHPLVNCISFTGGDTGIAICKKSGMVPIQVCCHGVHQGPAAARAEQQCMRLSAHAHVQAEGAVHAAEHAHVHARADGAGRQGRVHRVRGR